MDKLKQKINELYGRLKCVFGFHAYHNAPPELMCYFCCWCGKAGHYVCYECFEKHHNESIDDEKHINPDGDYCGYDIIEKFCPVCIKEKEAAKKQKKSEKDPEYTEYLRLKEKFEK